jgi:TPR repeat protein
MYYEGLHKMKPNELSFAYCESAAKRENAKAMYMLSGLYKRGHGVAHSVEKSQEWLKKSQNEVDSLTRFHIDSWFRKYENS